MGKKVLLSFDVEEFDLPREHGAEIMVERGAKVSAAGLKKVLRLLKRYGVKATFFVTGNFAEQQPELVQEIVADGHEVGCHGVNHFEPQKTDMVRSKKIVERVAGVKVYGYRQPRMFEVDYRELKRCGYKYDSSVNPALVPGRYNHMNEPRKPYLEQGIIEVPVSVASGLRVPLFWLALHLFPLSIYVRLVRMSMRETGYFATYFHPWEFADLSKEKAVPLYIKFNSGDALVRRLEKVIEALKDCDFITYEEFIKNVIM